MAQFYQPSPNYYGSSYANEGANPYARYQNFGPSYQQSQNPNSITWVQGKAGAEAYPVAPGASVMLMDSTESVLYMKSADNTGRPMPLKAYDLVERTDKAVTEEVKADSIDYDKIRAIVAEEVDARLKNNKKGEKH